ncbi:tRNA pseudouridine synthase A [Pseudozobellia thermophila]|uniref:tRNA pseudouridine synthase A n=1 Tax=Pseudozobellia thermophila TaxID=192903 RepID=A0A1M6ETM2_9FLAO|nr:tRNA pseudouridine(38-40) synthase TruA [Pseudozobellia thermophila]SHI88763.1 tRNA pseudouridine38-40 synthase [Pseudozobellia thermophila]
MQRQRFYYLVRVQYLGFRYSGWQNQPGQKTIESMLVKTLKFVLPDKKFKVLGAGRTDAKVSALDMTFELFIEDVPLAEPDVFLTTLNLNLPPDIRALDVRQVDGAFNIIKDAKLKEYVYLFSCGEKNHPFAAPFLANIIAPLDIKAMKNAARLFEGTHDFSSYTARLREGTQTLRTVASCELRDNELLQANFFPEKSYALYISAAGFMRYQVRMIMGALILLGKGELSFGDLEKSLQGDGGIKLTYVAPASGLFLNQLNFQ